MCQLVPGEAARVRERRSGRLGAAKARLASGCGGHEGDYSLAACRSLVRCPQPHAVHSLWQVNNLSLLYLNEPNLLHNIKERFEERCIYTYTGQLELLAINPYEVPAATCRNLP